MIEILQKIARWSRALLVPSMLLAAAGLGLFAWSAVAADDDAYLIPGLLTAIWGIWLFSLISGFRTVPPPVDGSRTWRVRVRMRLSRAGYGLMAWIVLGAGMAALFLTARLLMLGVG